MTIKVAIFDLDGTLVNLPIDYPSLYEEFRKITAFKNIEPITKTVTALNEALRGEVFEAWTRAEYAVLPKMTVIKNGMALYEHYSEIPKALVTMQGRKTAERILNVLNLSFSTVITREDSLDRTAQIRCALRKLKLKPEDAILIGDRETDKDAAREIGCKFRMVRQ